MISESDAKYLECVEHASFHPIGWLYEGVFEDLRQRRLVTKTVTDAYIINDLGAEELRKFRAGEREDGERMGPTPIVVSISGAPPEADARFSEDGRTLFVTEPYRGPVTISVGESVVVLPDSAVTKEKGPLSVDDLLTLLSSCRTLLDQCADTFELEYGPDREAVKKCRRLVKSIDESRDR